MQLEVLIGSKINLKIKSDMTFFYYLFYKIFYMHSKGEKDFSAAFLAMLTTSAVFFLNAIFVIGFLQKNNLIPVFRITHFCAILLLLILICLSYFLFVYKNKYKNIEMRFCNENSKNKIWGGIVVFLYCIVSFLLVVFIAIYKVRYL